MDDFLNKFAQPEGEGCGIHRLYDCAAWQKASAAVAPWDAGDRVEMFTSFVGAALGPVRALPLARPGVYHRKSPHSRHSVTAL